MLGRRGFLKAIGAGVLGMALALRPPKKPMEVAFDFEPIEITDDLANRYYIQPAVKALCDDMDHRMMEAYRG